MEEAIQEPNNATKQHQTLKTINYKPFLILLNCFLVSVGQIGGVLLVRIYFLHGGERKWLASWLLTAGFPLLIFPIVISYVHGRTKANPTRLLVTRRLVVASATLGFLLGIDSYLYTLGMSYLPVSVSSLLSTTQLVFTAFFAFILVKHRFTYYSINAVFLMALGSVVLGIHMSGDRPKGESDQKYFLGFFMTLAGAGLHGFLMVGVEYSHQNAGIPVTFDLLMQVQLLISMFATLFCSVAMIINKDFQAISKEATKFGLGETKYYMVLFLAAIALQLMVIGCIGLIFCSSSLFGGIVSAFLVPNACGIFSVKFSTDGRELVAGTTDDSICVYDLNSNKLTLRITAHTSDVNTVCFADETGHLIYSGSDDGLCKVWDRRCIGSTRKPAGVLIGHLEGITFIDSRRDGVYFISNGKDQTTKLWDIRRISSNTSCDPVPRNYDWDYRWMDYPPQARNLKHPHDQSVATYKGHSILRTLIRCYFSPAYSTGQRYIYTGSHDSCVYIYDLVSGDIVGKLKHHKSPVRDCSWHPYYPMLVSSSWDGDVVKWEFPGGGEATAAASTKSIRRRYFH